MDLKTLNTHYKIHFSDNDVLTVYCDSEKTKQELETFEAGSSQSYDAFIKETERLYITVQPLLYKCFTFKDLFDFHNFSLNKGVLNENTNLWCRSVG